MTNPAFLAAEAAIKARLAAKLPVKLPDPHPTVHVLTAPELALIEEQSQVTPAVYVVYQGIRPEGSPGGNGQVSGVAKIGQDFAVVVAVTNAATTTDGQGARDEAAPIVLAILETLLGWKPAAGLAKLELSDSPEAYFADGFMYVPLVLTTSFTLRGDPT